MRHGDPIITRRGLVYHTIMAVMRVAYLLYFRARIVGKQNIPRGRVLVVANHQSGLDIPLIAIGMPRHLAFMARDTLANFKPLAWVMHVCGTILIARGKRDRKALQRAVEHLEQEDAVVIFAEGTRTRTGRLGRFRKGALFTARRGRAPMLPTVVKKSYDAMRPGSFLPRPLRLEVHFLEPVDSDLPDAMHRVHMAIAECLGEEVEPQADLQNVPLDEDERQASRGPGAPAGSPDSRTAQDPAPGPPG